MFFVRWNRPWKTIHISLRKKSLVTREHKRRNICNFSRTLFFCFLLKWTKSGKEVIYRKKNGGHRAFKRVKSLRSSQRDCLFALSRHCMTFSRRPGVHSYPIMPHAFTFHSCGNVCTFSIVFNFVFCDASRACDMREKMRSSNGCERP